MKSINHIAIYTDNLEQLTEFYTNYFYAVKDSEYYNPATQLRTCFLRFDGPTRLEIMTRPNLTQKQTDQYVTGYTHLSFSVGSEEEVDSLTAELFKAGCQIITPPRVTGDGYYESCVADPDGNQVEITK